MKGCREALLDYYTDIMRSIGIAALLIWLFEVSLRKVVCVRITRVFLLSSRAPVPNIKSMNTYECCRASFSTDNFLKSPAQKQVSLKMTTIRNSVQNSVYLQSIFNSIFPSLKHLWAQIQNDTHNDTIAKQLGEKV